MHYDTLNAAWMPLNEGDVQVIRAGSGISHAEKFTKGSSIFQIWFDPDLHKALRKKPSYNDYASSLFPTHKEGPFTVKVYKGEGSPMQLDTEGVEIKEVAFEAGNLQLDLDTSKANSVYLLEGTVKVDGNDFGTDDFMVIREQPLLSFTSNGPGKWFIISTPLKPSYSTYAQTRGFY